MAGLYVYGVLREGADCGDLPPGAGGAPVTTLAEGSLAALVSEVPPDGIRGRRADLQAHTGVLQAALSRATVAPMRFGIVMDDEATVREELLTARAAELAALLERLDGRVELSVQATYHQDVLLREAVRRDPAIETLRERVRGLPEAATHFERIRLGEHVARAVEAIREQDGAELRQLVEPLAVEVKGGAPLHERTAANLSLLVDGERFDEVEAALESAARERAERMRIKLTGPLPAFSFVAEAPAWA